VDDLVDQACEQVVANLRGALGDALVSVALDGSAARRPAGPWNDLDFYVIVRGLKGDSRERDRRVHEAARPLAPPLRCSFLSKTPEEFDADVTSLMLDLALDARLLWDPEAYFGPRLARLRNLLQEAQLERQEREFGFLWIFHRWPRGPWQLDWNGFRELAR
jgi:hypothetical protein